jgi:hypothetical protein
MGTRKNIKPKKSNKIFRKTRSKRGGNTDQEENDNTNSIETKGKKRRSKKKSTIPINEENE